MVDNKSLSIRLSVSLNLFFSVSQSLSYSFLPSPSACFHPTLSLSLFLSLSPFYTLFLSSQFPSPSPLSSLLYFLPCPLSFLLLSSLLYLFSLCFLSPFSSFPLSSSSPLPFFFSLSSLILPLPLPCSSSSLVPFFLSLSLPPRRSSTRETKRADRVMQNLCKQQR